MLRACSERQRLVVAYAASDGGAPTLEWCAIVWHSLLWTPRLAKCWGHESLSAWCHSRTKRGQNLRQQQQRTNASVQMMCLATLHRTACFRSEVCEQAPALIVHSPLAAAMRTLGACLALGCLGAVLANSGQEFCDDAYECKFYYETSTDLLTYDLSPLCSSVGYAFRDTVNTVSALAWPGQCLLPRCQTLLAAVAYSRFSAVNRSSMTRTTSTSVATARSTACLKVRQLAPAAAEAWCCSALSPCALCRLLPDLHCWRRGAVLGYSSSLQREYIQLHRPRVAGERVLH